MNIKKLSLQNFRCFERLDVVFPEQYAVLIGINGAGKSSILDALSIAFGSFLTGCGMPAINLHKSDARYQIYNHSGEGTQDIFIPNREPQYPVRIGAEMQEVDGKQISWVRALNSDTGRTTIGEARPIMNYAESLNHRVRKNLPVIMPLLAYYGTGRLWLPKRLKRSTTMSKVPSRMKGYLDALDAASNEKLMLEWFQRAANLEYKSKAKTGEPLPIFQAVKNTMARFYKGIDDNILDIIIEYDLVYSDIEIIVSSKDGNHSSLPLRYLSDGIKSMLSMVADIAYRMATLNPHLGATVIESTEGIVLIDEIDMHLHPSWQKKILQNLCRTFPKVQFIVTTHAPAVLSNVPSNHILFLEHGKIYKTPAQTYGRDSTAILRDVMGTEIRPKDVLEKKEQFYDELQKENFLKAENIMDELKKILGENDEDIIRMQISLDMEKM